MRCTGSGRKSNITKGILDMVDDKGGEQAEEAMIRLANNIINTSGTCSPKIKSLYWVYVSIFLKTGTDR